MRTLTTKSARRRAASLLVLALAAGSTPLLGATAATAAPGQGVEARQSAQAVPFTEAVLVPGASEDTWTISWRAPGAKRVTVRVGADADSIASRPALVSHDADGSLTFTNTSARPWVRLSANGGAPLDVTTRSLGLDGASNFRDAGGHRTTDGRWVRYGVLYRSSALTLTTSDSALVDSLGLTGVFDLRTASERAETPNVEVPGAPVRHLDVNGEGGGGIPAVTSPAAAEQLMIDAEIGFVDSPTARTAYRELFTELATADGASVYHCTAGKDRTGWASVVLLTLLGVSAETVMADYLLSNTYYLNSPEVQEGLSHLPAHIRAIYEPLLAVRAAYLQAGLDRVAEEFGSMRAYAIEGLGLTPALLERLEDTMLVGAPTS